MVYTFCLSLVYVLLYVAAFNFSIEWFSPLTASRPLPAICFSPWRQPQRWR